MRVSLSLEITNKLNLSLRQDLLRRDEAFRPSPARRLAGEGKDRLARALRNFAQRQWQATRKGQPESPHHRDQQKLQTANLQDC